MIATFRTFFYSALQVYGLQMSREAVPVHHQGKSLNLAMLIRSVSQLVILSALIITTLHGFLAVVPILGGLAFAALLSS